MATGFLKFDHDHTVYIDLDLTTDEVNKAVIIDADDVETPICGGGSSDSEETAPAEKTAVNVFAAASLSAVMADSPGVIRRSNSAFFRPPSSTTCSSILSPVTRRITCTFFC